MMDFFEKIKHGLIILGISFKMIWKNKTYLIFPLITTLIITTVIIAIIMYAGIGYGISISTDQPTQTMALIVALFLLMFVSSMIAMFISVSCADYTMQSLQTSNPRLDAAFSHSLSRFDAIIKWALLSAIVGLIFRIFASGRNNNGGPSLLTNIWSEMAGLAWGLAIFFMPSVIASETLGTFASLKRSTTLMKNTFGQSFAAGFGFSLVFGLVIFLVPLGLVSFYTLSFDYLLLPLGLMVAPEIRFVAFFVAIPLITIFLLALISTAQTIFKTAVYAYATGKPTGPFPSGLIQTSFVKEH